MADAQLDKLGLDMLSAEQIGEGRGRGRGRVRGRSVLGAWASTKLVICRRVGGRDGAGRWAGRQGGVLEGRQTG